jgi:Pectate lyase superfamily protein
MPAISITDLNNAKLDADHIADMATSLNPTCTDRLGHVKQTMSAAGNAVAVTAAGQATAARIAAEAARDASFANAMVYATVAAGLAATASGGQFQVVVGSEIIRYRDDAGTATEVARYPRAGFLRFMGMATPATVPEAAKDNYYTVNAPGTYTNFNNLVVGNEIAQLKYDGGLWVKTTVHGFDSPIAVGRVVSGAIYPVAPTAPSTYALKVAPGTVVEAWGMGASDGLIAVTAGVLEFDPAQQYAGACHIYIASNGALSHTGPAGNGAFATIPPSAVLIMGKAAPWAGAYPLLPSNHCFGGTVDNLSVTPIPFEVLNVKSFGAVADGVADSSWVMPLLTVLSRFYFSSEWHIGAYHKKSLPPFIVYFPAGTYLIDKVTAGVNWKFIGDGKTQTVIKPYSETPFAWGAGQVPPLLENIGFQNISGTKGEHTKLHYKNVKLSFTSGVTTTETYGLHCLAENVTFENSEFDFQGAVYAAAWVYGYKNVKVKDCVFNPAQTGAAWHNLRLADPVSRDSSAEVSGNTFYGGTTGIFLGSNRVRPTENVLIERNKLFGQLEESIGLDGFGNNAGLCPVICNGPILTKSNDAEGRLVISFTMTYATDSVGTQATYTVAERTDWTNFYFSLDEGSGREGTITRIVSTNSANNEFTLDLRTPAADINLGGYCGVQSGFFDCIIRNNVIVGSIGAAPAYNYGTALSVYINVFNTTVENNTVIGCAVGLNLVGGLMLGTFRSLAYNNIVRNNRFLSCNEREGGGPAVMFTGSLYGGTVKQYNNQFTGNVIQGGKVGTLMQDQPNLIYKDNIIENVDNCLWKRCANTLPTPNSSQLGKTFMKITDDANGDPTTIDYHVCKLAGGVYSWVAV